MHNPMQIYATRVVHGAWCLAHGMLWHDMLCHFDTFYWQAIPQEPWETSKALSYVAQAKHARQ